MRSTLWHGVLPKARIRLREGQSGRRMPSKFASSFSVAFWFCVSEYMSNLCQNICQMYVRIYVKFMSEYMPHLCQNRCRIHVRIYANFLSLKSTSTTLCWAASIEHLLSACLFALSFFLSLLYLPPLCKVDLRQQMSKWRRSQEVSRWMNASKSPNRRAHWHGVSQKKCLRLFGQSWPDTLMVVWYVFW